MPTPPSSTDLLQEAERARQVVNVLGRLETRIADGRWVSGYRFGPDGGTCLIGAIDEATEWVQPGVAQRVTEELVERLPAPFKQVGKLRPRFALAAFNDTVGGRDGALDLVRRTRYALGGLPITEAPAPVERTEPDRVIDVTETWVAKQPLSR